MSLNPVLARPAVRAALRGCAALALGLSLAAAPLGDLALTSPPPAPVPRNVIVLVGDGMGFQHVAAASLYEHGVSYRQVAGRPGDVHEIPGTPSWSFEHFPVQLAMATYLEGGSYDPDAAWADVDAVRPGATDSAAASTAMATGHKTRRGAVGVDADGRELTNVSERAVARGKAAGVVTSVPFSHATPAGWAAHDPDRHAYRAIAHDLVWSDLTVVMGAGHPDHTRNGAARSRPDHRYLSADDQAALASGAAGFALVEDADDFAALTTGPTPARVFGLARVARTLQQERSGVSRTPGSVPFLTGVPSLATMAAGALNVLDEDPDGFSLLVEGGAIDWAAADNQTARVVEETVAFARAVDTVVAWVEANSSWEETLVVVTADHETGYLGGVGDEDAWTPLTGERGALPTAAWGAGRHTNMLVPLYARGAGSDALARRATASDPVRGPYVDNTALGDLLLQELWP